MKGPVLKHVLPVPFRKGREEGLPWYPANASAAKNVPKPVLSMRYSWMKRRTNQLSANTAVSVPGFALMNA